MLTHRRQIAGFLRSGLRLRSKTSRLLSGLGLAASASPHIAEAARKGQRRADNQEHRNDGSGNNQDDPEQRTQKERGSDLGNEKVSTEEQFSGDGSGKSGKRSRDESRNKDEQNEQGGSDGGTSRGESSRRNADSDSSSRDKSSANEDGGEAGGRRVREFEQRADETVEDTPAVTTITPANPNVVIDDIPNTSIADLVVEANDDVIATVSANGGFAFARSGDVIAVSGPDGASIVQAGDLTIPTEPSDEGGNNDLDFTS